MYTYTLNIIYDSGNIIFLPRGPSGPGAPV